MKSAASGWKYLISFVHINLTASMQNIPPRSPLFLFPLLSLTLSAHWGKPAITKPRALVCFLAYEII